MDSDYTKKDSLRLCRHNIDLGDWIGRKDYRISWRSSYRIERQTILDAVRGFAPLATGRLLDIGCGHKPYLTLFSPHVDEYVGLDVVESPIGNDADVIGSYDALPFHDASFDTVIATQVMEHIPEPHTMMKEIARVLRPGGAVLITVPLTWPLHETPHDYQRLTRFGLEHVATAAGLRVQAISSRGGFWMMMSQLLSEYMKLHRPKHWFSHLLYLPFLPLRPLLFRVAEGLDSRFPEEAFTLGYAMTARKPV